ncbi:MAG TPA: hypothetical protein VF214_06660 [Edaphobacter sp.]
MKHPEWKSARWVMGFVASGFMVVSILFGIWFGFGKGFDPRDWAKVAQAVVLGIWVIAPPIWFWYEYFFLYPDTNITPKPSLDEFKHGQEQASKIWLALVTLLLGLYFGKDLVRETSSVSSPTRQAPASQQSEQ